MVHTRDVDGRTLHFGHSGWLWRSAFLLYDRETDSLWHHQTGRALSGPLRGRSLGRLPVTHTTWGAWRAEHAATLVLPKPADPDAPVEVDVYARRNATLVLGVGVDLPRARRLYPLRAVRAAGLVHDEIDGVSLVVAADPASDSAHVFDRTVGGTALRFRVAAAADGRPLLREENGARTWSLRTGLPVPRDAGHPPLRTLLSTPWDAAAWRLHHEAGTIWSPE